MPNALQDKMDIGKSMLDCTKKELSKKNCFKFQKSIAKIT